MINFDYTNESELISQMEFAIEKLKLGSELYSSDRNCKFGNRLHLELQQWYLNKRDYVEKQKLDQWVHLVKSKI